MTLVGVWLPITHPERQVCMLGVGGSCFTNCSVQMHFLELSAGHWQHCWDPAEPLPFHRQVASVIVETGRLARLRLDPWLMLQRLEV